MTDQSGRVVHLDQLRPGDARALCRCGCGVFTQSDPDTEWRCQACGEVRATAEQVAAAVARARAPALTWRCVCTSVVWRVGLGGLVCHACGVAVSFDTLFAKR